MTERDPVEEYRQLEQAIATLEAQRALLGDGVVDSMIAAAREKLAALDQPVPPSLSRKAERVRGRPQVLQGERKQVTVIIVDVKGSTHILEQIGTEAWVKLMNRLFQILETEIYRFGGRVDQFRGDGLVAFFGATTTHEDDPERAVLASLAMQSTVKRFAASLRQREDIELQLRIGVNTGEVIVTSIGDEHQHSENTAMGEAITLAARMEVAAEPGTILVGESTYQLTRAQFKWQALGKTHVKGISQPLAVYRPLASKLPAGKVRGIAGVKAPMIGRENEFQALREAIVRLRNGSGGIVTIVGEAGLGKSRLVAEAHEAEVRTKPAATRPRWIEGRCRSYGASIAYLLWVDVLRGLLEVTSEDSPRSTLNKLRRCISTLSKNSCRYPDRLDSIYPYLGHLMSLPLETEAEAAMDDLEGERLKRGTFRAIEALVEGIAQQRPLVIVCEDLHWADPTSLELLERLFKITERVPLLFICVLRPETMYGGPLIQKIAAQRYSQQHTDLWLVPLSPVETEALIDNLLQAGGMPPSLKTRILNHAEGNPFYVEEIVRSLMDSGAVVQHPRTGHWQVTHDVIEIAIPPTLYGVLMARIDRLPASAKRVLQMASVIGRIFRYRVLQAIAPKQHSLDRLLGLLQREGLIHARAGTPELEYIFKHHLIKEAAYNSLLKREQQTLHRRVARVLEQVTPGQDEQQIGLLAYHWGQAERPQKAITYLMRAGKQAAAQFANTEAVNYYSRALALLPENTNQHYKALSSREKLYDLLGARERQSRDLAALEALAETLEEPARQAEIALRQAHYAEVTGAYTAAIDAAQTAINLAKIARDGSSEAAGYLMWGRALFYLGDNRAAREQLYQALNLSVGFPKVQADTLRSLGMAAFDLDEAREYQNQALHIHRKIGDRRGEWATLYNLSDIAIAQGNYVRANSYCDQALQICREIGDRQGESMALHNLAYICVEQGDYEGARAYSEQVLAIFRKTEDREGQAQILTELSLAAHSIGDYAYAVSYARQAYRIAQELDNRSIMGDSLLALGHAYVGLEEMNEAANVYQHILELDEARDNVQLAMEALAGLAQVASVRGDLRRAGAYVKEILHELGTANVQLMNDLSPVYLTCVRVLDAHHDPRVRQLLIQAYTLLQDHASQLSNREARQTYLERTSVRREIVHRYHQMQDRQTDL